MAYRRYLYRSLGLGLTVPVGLFTLHYILVKNFLSLYNYLYLPWSALEILLWPSGMIFGIVSVFEESFQSKILAFLLSIIINGAIYALIGSMFWVGKQMKVWIPLWLIMAMYLFLSLYQFDRFVWNIW